MLALMGAAVSASIGGYGLYKTVTYPGFPGDRHVTLIENFQWLGAIAFFLPILGTTVALVGVAVLLIRGRATVGQEARPWTAIGQRWIAVANMWATRGYLPGLLVAAVVGAADQLTRRPLTLSTWIGSAVAMLVFVAAWIGARRLSERPSRVKVGRAIAVTAVVAALVFAGAATRVEDENNLALWDQTQSPMSTGFHTVAAKSRPSVQIFLPTCANSTDCVAIGTGMGYDSNPWRMWGLLGTTTTGGASWTVKAIPDATIGEANCGPDICSMAIFYRNSPADLLRVTFDGSRSANISQQSVPSSLPLHQAPICTANHCLGFATKWPGVAGNKALYSDDSGTTWSATALPAPPRLGARSERGLFGPWCSTAVDCRGALVDTFSCAQPDGTTTCSQVTVIRTLDGGRTWSEQSDPINDPPSGAKNLAVSLGLRCTRAGVCTGVSADDRIYLSDNWGVTWNGPMHLPSGADDVLCFSATGCVTSGGRFATSDAGNTWVAQTAVGTAMTRLTPTWCSTTGSCIGWGLNTTGQTLTLARSTDTSTWQVHSIPQPQLQPAATPTR